MSDYIKREDALNMLCEECPMYYMTGVKCKGEMLDKCMQRRTIERVPAADTVEATHCKNCKHRPYKGQWGIEGDAICPCICDDSYYNYIPDDDWFCKNGEIKS